MKTKIELFADYAPTPRYVTLDDSVPSFDYVIVGAGLGGLEAAVTLSGEDPDITILIIESSKDDEHLRVLPLGVSLRLEQNDLVNRSLTEWTAQVIQLPVVPQVPNLLTAVLPIEPTLYTVNLNKEITDNSLHDARVCDLDLKHWRNARTHGVLEGSTDSVAKTEEFVKTLQYRKNVTLLTGTDVTMINYKQRMVGTRKLRIKFDRAVIFAASLKNLIPNLGHTVADAQPSIRFYPSLDPHILESTNGLKLIHIERTQFSFDEPFWRKDGFQDNVFYVRTPELADILRFTCSSDKRSLEVAYCSQAHCNTGRVGRNIREESLRILKVLSSTFSTSFKIDDNRTVSADPKYKHISELVGVRHVSSRANYQRSICVNPNEEQLLLALRDHTRSTSEGKLIFVKAEGDGERAANYALSCNYPLGEEITPQSSSMELIAA